jgi:hypothetical protein
VASGIPRVAHVPQVAKCDYVGKYSTAQLTEVTIQQEISLRQTSLDFSHAKSGRIRVLQPLYSGYKNPEANYKTPSIRLSCLSQVKYYTLGTYIKEYISTGTGNQLISKLKLMLFPVVSSSIASLDMLLYHLDSTLQ